MPDNEIPEWRAFENAVASTLGALGYTVEQDVLIAGSQVDLRATRTRDLFTDRLVVECKNQIKAVGVAMVRQFHALVDTISRHSEHHQGILICPTGFTAKARAYAAETELRLVTFDELKALSFDPTKIVDHLIQAYRDDELSAGYVDLSCQVAESGKGTIYKPVERFLDKFLLTTQRPGVAILGNFGTGKTSLCKHYSYLLANRWKNGTNSSLLPIYINLREIGTLRLISQSITDTLNRDYQYRTNISSLESWLILGRTLLVLDGFDEMAAKLPREEIFQNARALANYGKQFKTKIILTCRTHFFKTQVDEEPLSSFLKLYMCDWGTKELVDYIEKRAPEDVESSLELIRSTYNLEELSRTPIFLSMIESTLKDVGEAVNKAKLYQLYTDKWIESQNYRSRIPPEDKRALMEHLSYEMFVTGNSRIRHNELPEQIKLLFRLQDYESLFSMDRDVRTSSFLVRDHEGYYYFVHRSYMEYFVASRMAKAIKDGDFSQLAAGELTIEIASFIACYFEHDSEILIRTLMGHRQPGVRRNVATILGYIPRNPRLRNTLLVALDAEGETMVQFTIVNSLMLEADEVILEHVVGIAEQRNSLGAHCIEQLGGFVDEPIVFELLNRVLRGSSREHVIGALRAVQASAPSTLNEPLQIFFQSEWWRGDRELERAGLGALQVTSDLKVALAAEYLVHAAFLPDPLKTVARSVKQRLQLSAQPEIDAIIQRKVTEGLSYTKIRGYVSRTFRYLADDEHVKSSIKQYISAIPSRNRKGRKRGQELRDS